MVARNTIKAWIDTCREHAERMTPWEQDFIVSVHEQFDEGRDLSERQLEILERIYADKTP